VKIFFGKEWLAIRPSGTEPLFRVFTEARTEERAKELNDKGVEIVKASFEEVRSFRR
jgi:phosphomannomutase/phosphoglucomutase